MTEIGALARLVDQLQQLPGIGAKSAQRLAFHLLRQPREDVDRLLEAIRDVKEQITYCSVCSNITDADPCHFCTHPSRDQQLICVVEDPHNVSVIEKTGQFGGVYHVLMGALSPLQGIGPDDLKIRSLLGRIEKAQVREVILATNPNVEGEATAIYLAKLLKPLGVSVTRIAVGLPVGSDLDYADEGHHAQGDGGPPGTLAACGKTPLHSSGDASRLDCVAHRSHIFEYAHSSRLASHAPHRSRCDAGFYHRLLARVSHQLLAVSLTQVGRGTVRPARARFPAPARGPVPAASSARKRGEAGGVIDVAPSRHERYLQPRPAGRRACIFQRRRRAPADIAEQVRDRRARRGRGQRDQVVAAVVRRPRARSCPLPLAPAPGECGRRAGSAGRSRPSPPSGNRPRTGRRTPRARARRDPRRVGCSNSSPRTPSASNPALPPSGV